jgi:hypothetical protein
MLISNPSYETIRLSTSSFSRHCCLYSSTRMGVEWVSLRDAEYGRRRIGRKDRCSANTRHTGAGHGKSERALRKDSSNYGAHSADERRTAAVSIYWRSGRGLDLYRCRDRRRQFLTAAYFENAILPRSPLLLFCRQLASPSAAAVLGAGCTVGPHGDLSKHFLLGAATTQVRPLGRAIGETLALLTHKVSHCRQLLHCAKSS